jgi:hypothetical protein
MAWKDTPLQITVAIQRTLVKRINDKATEARDVALCAREWAELEFAKREWRGIPRLRAVEAERRLRRVIGHIVAPLELDDAPKPTDESTHSEEDLMKKESLDQPTPVTTPPTPEQGSAV